MAADSPPVLEYPSAGRRPPDWRGRTAAVGCGLVAGILVGISDIRDRTLPWPIFYGGPIIAGLAVGVASALAARSHPVLLALLGGVAVVASSLATFALWAWYAGRLGLGNALVVIPFLLLVGLGGLVLVCAPALVASVLVVVIRRRAA